LNRSGWGVRAVTGFERIPFFEGVTAAEAEPLSRLCVWRRYHEGELVLDFEDDSTDVYFIVSGEVRILIRTASGKEMIFGDMGQGQFFGEMAAIDGARRSANVTALTNAELCLVPTPAFKYFVLAHPVVCERLLVLLTGRIRDLNKRLFERSVLDLRHRLYAELLRLSQPRKGAPGQAIVSPPPLQQDLAARIGCRREQVSRELSLMVDDGLAERTKGALVLTKRSELERRVQDALDNAG
jgi:CRP/FNR family transcriptional regulator, cyclic AMP receptor protein